MNREEETNEDETEELDQVQCTNNEDGRIDEGYNVVGEEIGHEDADEEIDEDEEFADGSDDFDTEFEEDEELNDSEDFDTESERDENFDIDTGATSEFTVGEVDTDASSSHMVTVSRVKPSHAPMDAMTFAS